MARSGANIKGIKIVIGGDASEFYRALSSLEKESRTLQTELKKIDKLLKLDPSNTELLTRKQEILTDRLKTQEQELEKLKSRQDEVRQKWEKYGELKPQIEKVTAEIEQQNKELVKVKEAQEKAKKAFEEGKISEEQYNKTTEAVKSCKEELARLSKEKEELINKTVSDEEFHDYNLAVKETEQEVKNLKKSLENFASVNAQKIAAAGQKMQDFGKSIEDVGRKFQVLSGLGIAAFGGIIKTGTDWESAFTGVKKTVDGTDRQLAELGDGLLDLSKRTSSSATDIAGVAEAAGQLGIKTENVLEFTETMVKLGDTTNLSAEEAASALAKFANITGTSADDYSKLGSVIVDLGNNYATTEQDIVNMTTKLASTGSVVGLTEPQMLAIGTALSSVGIEAEAGGSAISKLLKKMETSVSTFDESEKVIKSTGYTLRDLEMMASHNGKQFKEVAANLGLTTNELKGFMSNKKSLEQFAEVAGVSADEFKKAYGEDAVGALSMFIDGLSDIDKNGGSAVGTLEGMGLTEVRLSNAILALSSSNDVLGSSLETANGAWDENTALNNEAEKKYGTSEAKMTQLKNTAIELGIKLSEKLMPAVLKIVETIRELAEKFTNCNPFVQKFILVLLGIVTVAAPLLIFIGKLVSGIGGIIKIIKVLKGVFIALNAVLKANPIFIIIAAIAAVIAILVLLYKKCEPFRNFVDNIAEKLKTFFTETIPQAFHAMIEWFKEKWQAIKEFFTDTLPQFFSNAWESIKLFFTETIPQAFQSLVDWFKELPYKIGYFIGEIIGHIVNFGVKIYEFFTVKIPEYIKRMIEWFKSLPQKIKDGIHSAIEHISQWCIDMKQKATDGIHNLITKVVTFFRELPGKIKDGIAKGINVISQWCVDMKDKAVEGVKNVVQKIKDGFKELPGKMKDIGKSIVEGIWNGIKNAGSWIKNKVGEFSDGIKDGFKFALKINSPSKVMRDEIGKSIPEGVAVGIEANADAPVDAMKKVTARLTDAEAINAVSFGKRRKTIFADSHDLQTRNTGVEPLKDAFKQALSELDLGIYLDGDTLVGKTIKRINSALEDEYTLSVRGG